MLVNPSGVVVHGAATVTVAPVNDAPTIDTTPVLVQQNTPIDIDLRALASDVETGGDDLTFVVGTAVGGTAVLLSDGFTVRFTPSSGYYGTASFSLSVTDTGNGGPPATVALTAALSVNRPPVALDATFTVGNAGPAVLPLASFVSDPDGDAVTVTEVTTPTAGGASINAAGQVVYLPPAGFTGTVTFEYVIGDGRGGTARANVTITVTDGEIDIVIVGTGGNQTWP